MTLGPGQIDNPLRNVLICGKPHLRRNRVCLILVGQVACVSQASQDVFPRQTGVVGKDFAFRLARGQQVEDELNGEARSADHRLSRQDLGVDDDAF